MTNVASLAGIAALIGDPARASMLVTLMDGRALTAGELGEAAGVAPSTASGHLGRLLDSGVLALERQGRHRYYRLASASVATSIESMMSLSAELGAAASRRKPVWTGPRDKALRRARLCYDHLAGEVAVLIADRMVARGEIEFGIDGGMVTEPGLAFLNSLGVDLADRSSSRAQATAFCRPCLDWSERRPHVAGMVGRAVYEAFARNGWLRAGEGRAVTITPLGASELYRLFNLSREIAWPSTASIR